MTQKTQIGARKEEGRRQSRPRDRRNGQTLVEYSFIFVLVVVILIAAYSRFGNQVANETNEVQIALHESGNR